MCPPMNPCARRLLCPLKEAAGPLMVSSNSSPVTIGREVGVASHHSHDNAGDDRLLFTGCHQRSGPDEIGRTVQAPEVVVIHEDDVATESWDGIVSWKTLLSADRTPTAGLTVGVASIAPGAAVDGALHHHEPHEIYFVISGDGLVHLDGSEHPIAPGTSVFIPGGTHHFIRNTGDSELRLLYAFDVDSFDEVAYEFPEHWEP